MSLINITEHSFSKPFLPNLFPLPSLDQFSSPSENCLLLEKTWDEIQTLPRLLPTLSCSSSSCFFNDLKINLKYQKSQTGCSFSIDSLQSNTKLDIEIENDKNILTFRSPEHLFTTTTDFSNSVHAKWEELTKKDSPSNGEFQLDINPSNPEEVSILFKNGDSSIQGDCRIGDNEVLCSFSKGGISSLFSFFKVQMSKNQDEHGLIHYRFDATANSRLPFTTPKKLGYFEYHIDPSKGTVSSEGYLKNLYGKTLWNGNLNCSQFQTCDSFVKFDLSSDSQEHIETLSYKTTPSSYDHTLKTKRSDKNPEVNALMRDFVEREFERSINVNGQDQTHENGSRKIAAELNLQEKRDSKETSKILGKIEADLQDKKEIINGSLHVEKENLVESTTAMASHVSEENRDILRAKLTLNDGKEFFVKSTLPKKPSL